MSLAKGRAYGSLRSVPFRLTHWNPLYYPWPTMVSSEHPDPIYKYVDDKVEQLKYDLLSNEIADIQDKVDAIQGQLPPLQSLKQSTDRLAEQVQKLIDQFLALRRETALIRLTNFTNCLWLNLAIERQSMDIRQTIHRIAIRYSAQITHSMSPEKLVDDAIYECRIYLKGSGLASLFLPESWMVEPRGNAGIAEVKAP